MVDVTGGPVVGPPETEKAPAVVATSGTVAQVQGRAPSLASYVLLSLDKSGYWTFRDELPAGSAEAAVRAFAKAAELKETVTLVAIPARSWRPVTVAVKTTTSLVIEEAQS